jgi:hypothetical protein
MAVLSDSVGLDDRGACFRWKGALSLARRCRNRDGGDPEQQGVMSVRQPPESRMMGA